MHLPVHVAEQNAVRRNNDIGRLGTYPDVQARRAFNRKMELGSARNQSGRHDDR
jgi:hypothetical protein